jgi:ADP-ribosyl-[dinitrogen reductase] hydrolase
MGEQTMDGQQTVSRSDRFRGCLLGLAAGDAVGTTLEFRIRESFEPLTDMLGGGPFRLEPGEWTDDTSMALCLAASLIERRGFDAKDQMDRYVRWLKEGYMSSNGRAFDIGNTVADALKRYRQTGEPYAGSDDPRSAANGSLMRLAPVVLYFSGAPREEALKFAELSSRTTHGARECLDACRLFAEMLLRALEGAPKEAILFGHEPGLASSPNIAAIARGDYRSKSEAEIRGTGYVVASLEAALWCFLNTDSFEAAILRAANLGDDADTTAAICGQIAGAYYGESGIPGHWLERLVMADEIRAMADQLVG